MQKRIRSIIEDSIRVKQTLLEGDLGAIEKVVMLITKAFQEGHRVFFCGNGGSAADSQHIAAEFIGRFQKERRALPAIALTTDTSILTCLSNDYSYDIVFARQIEGLAQAGDVLVGLSTSGKSVSIVKAFEKARQMGVVTVAIAGHDGGLLSKIADVAVVVPSKITARIQESHITIAHVICELVEDQFLR